MWSDDYMKEVPACRGCLVTDVKLHNIYENRLVEHYEVLVGIPLLSSDVYPQHLCSYCCSQLFKFVSFRARCRKSQELLRDTKLAKKCLTIQNIRTIYRDYYQLTTNYVRTNTEIIEFIGNKHELDNGLEQEDCMNDYIDDDSDVHCLTDHNIKNNLEIDDIVNKEEKNRDSELEQPIALFDEVQKFCKDNKVKDITVRKERNYKNVPCRKEIINNEPLDLDANLLPKSDQSNRDGDSEWKEPISVPIDNPKEVKRKKVVKNIIVEESKNGENLSGNRGRTDGEIKKFANSLDFDVKFLTKDEQFKEVEERKMSDVNDPLIIKCDLCGQNFRDHNTAAAHHKDCHDPAAGHHICEICFRRFKKRTRLLSHLRIHRAKFCCKNCNFFTKNIFNLTKHKNWHQGKLHICPYCKRMYSNISSCLTHVRLRHASELPWCNLCGESFIGEKGIRAHQKRAHKDIEKCEYKCKNCNTNFINKEAFKRHEETNKCDLSSCITCGESFVSEQLLKYHLVQHHTRENVPEVHNIECERCKVKFQNAFALKRHGDVCLEGGFACVQCGASFTTSDLLNEHMIEKHTLEHTFKCEECDKTFSNAYYFREHYSKVHLSSLNVFDENLLSRKSRLDREGKGKLRSLKKRAVNRGIDKSIRKWRVVDEEAGDVVMEKAGDAVMEKATLAAPVRKKSIMCEVCGRKFLNPALLKYHQRVHSGERPFKCTQCPKTFMLKTGLTAHIRVHTGERPYLCEDCNKTFKTQSGLYRHSLIHSGLRRHVCQLCDKAFQMSTDCKMHIKTVHMKLPMPPRNRRRNRLKDE